jgi:xanthine dehydrogenase YagR molybdenum-binding subunit
VTFADDKIQRKNNGAVVSLTDAMRAGKVDRIEKQCTAAPNEKSKYAHYTHSAIFAEVKVDEQIGLIRVTRIVNAVAAGRILNPKIAASQILGAVVGGIGMALHEETVTDHRFGRFMNHNFADYHVPVNADVHAIDVIFVDEQDDEINPLGVKGVGEIGIVGTAAAIANAIYHATGKRVRDLPITIDKLLGN